MSCKNVLTFVVCALLSTVSACQGPATGTSTQPPPNATEALATPGQAEDNNSTDAELLVRLGDKELTMQQVKWRLPDPTDRQIAMLAKAWIRAELLYAEAERRGIPSEPQTQFLAEMQKKGVIAQELERQLRGSVQVTDEMALQYYEKNKDKDFRLFRRGSVTFSHVRTPTREQAESVLNRIKAGEQIEPIAKELSIHPDRENGGFAEKFSLRKIKSSFGNDFAEAIRAAKQGELIGPIELEEQQGYEIARKHEQAPPEPRPFERVKPYIMAHLKRTEGNKAVKSMLEELKEKASDKIIKSQRLIEAEKTAAERPAAGRRRAPAAQQP